MTFIYTTPSTTHQKPLKELACSWLVNGSKPETLQTNLDSLVREIKLSEQKQKRFISLLTSDSAMLYKKALAEVRNLDVTSSAFDAVVNKYGVSAYEMRYILAISKKCND